MELLFAKLSMCGTSPGILFLVPPYSDNYVPKSLTYTFPTPLTEFYNPNLIDAEFDDLRSACDAVFITLTEEMSLAIEAATRSQAKCKLWYKYRSGRVTASRMKAVCSTAIENPSRSLIKSICYPDVCSFPANKLTGVLRRKSVPGNYTAKKLDPVMKI